MQPKIFPTQDKNLARLLFDPVYRAAFHARLKKYNPAVVALYRSGLLPLLGAGRSVMLLGTVGRKSKQRRYTPIGYWRIGGSLYVLSGWGKQAGWFKNLLAAPNDVTIKLGMRNMRVRPQPLYDPIEIQALLEQFVRESPRQAQVLLGWEPGRDSLAGADFSPIIQDVLIVRFVEKEEKKR